MKGFILGFFIASVLVGGVWYFTNTRSGHQQTQEAKTATKYHCPMHPTIIRDHPGDCPICGMKLVPIEENTSQAAPMEAHSESKEPVPEGYAPVEVSSEKLQLMGVTTAEVKEMDLDQSIRTTGRVVPDETRTHHVHTKFEGYIEDIYVNFTGQFVKEGEPLFSIYSPELLATQQEYLLALKAKDTFSASNSQTGIDLVGSARQRLALWDIGPQQIEQIEKTRQPIRAVIVRSPVSGFVTAKTAIQGTRIMPSDALYDIVDLSRVWIMADIYEVNLPFVKIGTPVTVQLPYEDDKSVTGKVMYLDPVLDPVSRTLKARIEVQNPGTVFKPEMFTTVILGGTRMKGLAVPESAVIATGERMIVFVQKGSGLFQPREVTTGGRIRGYYQIKSGLSAGERIVVSGNFLLDSESKLRAAISGAGTQHQH